MIIEGGSTAVLIVNAIIWGGLGIYLYRLRRKLAALD